MKLPFLDRHEEAARFRRLLGRAEGALGVVYGRRRCGKSRLLREILPAARSVYYVGDDREASLQRAGLATEIGRLLPGFERVTYPDWDALLARWWQEARPGMIIRTCRPPSARSSSALWAFSSKSRRACCSTICATPPRRRRS